MVKSLEHTYYFGPYELKMQLSYDPELDVATDGYMSEESLEGTKLSLERMIDVIFKNRVKSFFVDVLGISEGLLDKDEIAEKRKKSRSKIYTIKELNDEVMKDLLEEK